MGKYLLREVKTSKQAREFIRMAISIYNGDPMWVQPLNDDIESVFDPVRNHLFDDGEATRWTLHDQSTDKIVGRIAAFYNREQATVSEQQPTGGSGFFECIDNQTAANILFDAARDWLAERGMEAMDGSVNFGDRMQWWGVLVEGFTMPIYGMSYNPPYYEKMFEEYGFENYYNQYTYLRSSEVGIMPDATYQKADRLFGNPDYRFENVDMSKPEKVAADFREVYNSGWAAFPGIKPMTIDHAIKMMKTLSPIMDPDVAYFAFHKGQAIGFFINIPDLNPIIQSFGGRLGLWQKLQLMWRLKVSKRQNRLFGVVIGVSKAFQGKGVESAMMLRYEQYLESGKNKYYSMELAWIGDFNPLMMRIVESYVMATRLKRHVTYRYLFDRSKPFTRCPKMGRVKKHRHPSQSLKPTHSGFAGEDMYE